MKRLNNSGSDGFTHSEDMILLTISKIDKITEEKRRSVAGGMNEDEATLKYGIEILKETHTRISHLETESLSFNQFSPLQWFAFTGPLEILLITNLNQQTTTDFSKSMLKKSLDLLRKLEATLKSEDTKYAMELNDLKNKFYKLKVYAENGAS